MYVGWDQPFDTRVTSGTESYTVGLCVLEQKYQWTVVYIAHSAVPAAVCMSQVNFQEENTAAKDQLHITGPAQDGGEGNWCIL